ncbi:predicted protein, partial [Nematostella vectensis]
MLRSLDSAIFLVAFSSLIYCSFARHLQFHLSGYECFYQDILEKTECSLEFAPITGNDPKVDVTLEDPSGNVIYRVDKKDYDLHKFTTTMNGTYQVCFSNVYDFTIGENLVYFDFIAGVEDEFGTIGTAGETGPASKALTQLETSLSTIHENMNLIERYQNYYRLREANGRIAAESLNSKVQWWSIGQSIIVVL